MDRRLRSNQNHQPGSVIVRLEVVQGTLNLARMAAAAILSLVRTEIGAALSGIEGISIDTSGGEGRSAFVSVSHNGGSSLIRLREMLSRPRNIKIRHGVVSMSLGRGDYYAYAIYGVWGCRALRELLPFHVGLPVIPVVGSTLLLLSPWRIVDKTIKTRLGLRSIKEWRGHLSFPSAKAPARPNRWQARGDRASGDNVSGVRKPAGSAHLSEHRGRKGEFSTAKKDSAGASQSYLDLRSFASVVKGKHPSEDVGTKSQSGDRVVTPLVGVKPPMKDAETQTSGVDSGFWKEGIEENQYFNELLDEVICALQKFDKRGAKLYDHMISFEQAGDNLVYALMDYKNQKCPNTPRSPTPSPNPNPPEPVNIPLSPHHINIDPSPVICTHAKPPTTAQTNTKKKPCTPRKTRTQSVPPTPTAPRTQTPSSTGQTKSAPTTPTKSHAPSYPTTLTQAHKHTTPTTPTTPINHSLSSTPSSSSPSTPPTTRRPTESGTPTPPTLQQTPFISIPHNKPTKVHRNTTQTRPKTRSQLRATSPWK